MPRNGSGTYSLPQPPFVSGTVISSAAVNSDLSDIASALTGSLPRDGQAGMTGQLKLSDGSTIAPSITFNDDATTGFSHGTSPTTIGVSIGGVSVGTFGSTGWAGNVNGTGAAQVGMVIDFAGATAPSQWYLCYGQAVSRTTFSALFAVIGTTYGSGDGSTTFNLPDLRGTVVAGVDNMGGAIAGRLISLYYGANPDVLATRGGSQAHTLTSGEVPNLSVSVSGSVNISGTCIVPTQGFSGANQSGVAAGVGNNNTSLFNVSAPVSGSGSFSASGGTTNGGDSPFTIIQPTMVLNKIIFAGA